MGIGNDIKPKKDYKPPKKKIGDSGYFGDDNFEININNNIPEDKDKENIISDKQTETDSFEQTKYTGNNHLQDELFDPRFNHQPVKKSSFLTIWVIVLTLALIGLVIWQNFDTIKGYFGFGESLGEPSTQDQYYNSVSDQDYTSGAVDSNQDKTDQNQSEDNSSNQTNSAVDRSKVYISVLNGNGLSGSAQAVKEQLGAAGFTNIGQVTNALKFTYLKTTLYYSTGKKTEADDIISILSNRQCESYENASISGSFDVVVVVGKT